MLRKASSSRATLSRAGPLEARLARLPEGNAYGHVLGLAHMWPAATHALALASALVQSGGVVVERSVSDAHTHARGHRCACEQSAGAYADIRDLLRRDGS